MEPSRPLIAVVLAGGDRDDRLARTVGAASKALVPLRDVPMGAYVAAALRHSGLPDRVIWVGEADAAIRRWIDVELPGGRRMVDSLALGLGAALARTSEMEERVRILLVTADIPWWDAAGVRAFVQEAPNADLVYPIVREEVARARFPEQPRTFVRVRDGRFTGGNALLLKPRAIAPLLPVVDAAFHARKRPLTLAGIVGFGTLIGLLTGMVRVADVEARVEALLGISARAYDCPDAAIAADVDDPTHLPATLTLPVLPWDTRI